MSNLFASGRAHFNRRVDTLLALITKPGKTARDWLLIVGLVASIAAFVLFIAGPVTSAFVWWLGRRG